MLTTCRTLFSASINATLPPSPPPMPNSTGAGFLGVSMWAVTVDMLALAEQARRRTGRYPTLPELIRWMHTLGFRWAGGDMFLSESDATESLYHGEIIESCRLLTNQPSA